MNKKEAIEILSEMRSEYNLFGDEEEATRYHVLSWAIKEMNAAPVKHGEWTKTGQSFVNPNRFRNYCCSACGYDIEKTKYNYCPNCGTKMDGRKIDDLS